MAGVVLEPWRSSSPASRVFSVHLTPLLDYFPALHGSSRVYLVGCVTPARNSSACVQLVFMYVFFFSGVHY